MLRLFDIVTRFVGTRTSNEPAKPLPRAPLLTMLDEGLDPAVFRLRSACAAGDFAQATATIDASDPDLRSFLVRGLAGVKDRPAWMDAWVERDGKRSAVPWLVRGRHGIEWAWQARTRARARFVPPEAMRTFEARLLAADQDLERAADLAPDDAAPHAERVVIAMGLAYGTKVARERFGQAVVRAPHHYVAHHALVTALTQKWGGEPEEAITFAREAARDAPGGSRLHVLPAWAHAERWLYFDFAESPDLEAQLSYMKDPARAAELVRAWEMGPAAAGHPGGLRQVEDANVLAFCFVQAGDRERAREALLRTGGCVTWMPWMWVGPPKAAFATACRAMEMTAFDR